MTTQLLLLFAVATQSPSPAGAFKATAAAMKRAPNYEATLVVRAGSATETFGATVRPGDATAMLKAKLEVWCREHAYAAKTVSGTFVREAKLDAQQRRVVAPAVNPQMIVREALGSTPESAWAGEEKVGGVDCRIAACAAPTSLKKIQIPMMFEKLRGPTQANLKKQLDPATSVSSYRIWIGKQDGRVYKVRWVVEPKIGRSGALGGLLAGAANKGLKAIYTLTVRRYDKKIKLRVPKKAAEALK